nr:protein srg1 [Quercus suber]
MEPERTRLGSSMPVPSVQELAKETPSTVPPRYVRYDREPPIITDNTSLPQVPVIDMQRLFSLEFIDSELEKLHYASKEWGFFQVKVGVQEFFNLPMEEKKKLWQLPGDVVGLGKLLLCLMSKSLIGDICST